MFFNYMHFVKVLGIFYIYVPPSTPSIISSTDSNSVYLSCENLSLASCPNGYVCNFESYKCVPYCSIDCGLGRCVGPEECECDSGYYSETLIEDSEPPRCRPVCEFCEGTCVRPYTCVCEPEFQAINVSGDGGDCDCFGNCTGRICESTKCLPKSTVETKTTKEWSSSRNTHTSTGSYRAVTESNRMVTFGTTRAEEDYSYELFSTEADLNQYILETFQMSDTENEQKEAKGQKSYTWIYLTTGLVVLLIVVTVLIFKIRAVFNCFRGNTYTFVEEKLERSQRHSIDMNFFTIE